MENFGVLQQLFSGCKLCLCSICCDLSSAPWWTCRLPTGFSWLVWGVYMSTFSARLHWKTRNRNWSIPKDTLLSLALFLWSRLNSFDHSWYQLRFLLWSNAPWYSRGALLPVVAFAWGCLAASRCSNSLTCSETFFDSLAILELARVDQELHLCY